MKIRADRAELADALTWVAQAIPKRASIPVLAGMRLSAADDVLTLRAFDYETGHEARVSCEVIDDGEAVASGTFLRTVVGGLRAKEVELVLDGPRLAISAGRSAYRVQTMQVADYPDLPPFPTTRGTIDAEALVSLLGTVEHAAGRDLTQPSLLGVRLTGDSDELVAASTDRYRIARRAIDWDGTDELAAIVPAVGFVSAVAGLAGTVTIGHADGLFGVADGHRRITARCLTDFPEVDRALAGIKALGEVEIDATELADAVKRAAVAADEHGAVRLRFAEGEVEVTATDDGSDGAEYVACEGDLAHEVAVTGRYLTDALGAAASGRVVIGVSDGVRPMTVRPVDGEPVDLVVMPRRVAR